MLELALRTAGLPGPGARPDAAPVAGLCAALEALRLNHHYPAWRPIVAHLQGAALGPCPPAEGAAWPASEAWARAWADRAHAPALLPQLDRLAAAGDHPSAAEARRLRALLELPSPAPEPLRASLIAPSPTAPRFEVVVDHIDLAALRFVRWTVRLADPAGAPLQARPPGPDEVAAAFRGWLPRLGAAGPTDAALALAAHPGVVLDELIRGEIGPAVAGPRGPWLSAALSRVAALDASRVDDPLLDHAVLPSEDSPWRLAHHRKWAVPAADVAEARAWLGARGSRGLVYPWSAPGVAA